MKWSGVGREDNIGLRSGGAGKEQKPQNDPDYLSNAVSIRRRALRHRFPLGGSRTVCVRGGTKSHDLRGVSTQKRRGGTANFRNGSTSVKSFAHRAREFPNISLDSRAGAARMLVIYRMLVFQGKC